jgi:hypothetical protein
MGGSCTARKERVCISRWIMDGTRPVVIGQGTRRESRRVSSEHVRLARPTNGRGLMEEAEKKKKIGETHNDMLPVLGLQFSKFLRQRRVGSEDRCTFRGLLEDMDDVGALVW